MEGERECHMGVGIFTDDQEGLIEFQTQGVNMNQTYLFLACQLSPKF